MRQYWNAPARASNWASRSRKSQRAVFVTVVTAVLSTAAAMVRAWHIAHAVAALTESHVRCEVGCADGHRGLQAALLGLGY